ncbi:hypothetical protein B0I75DRAFT_110631, partial [Yarrowia lipolytica]
FIFYILYFIFYILYFIFYILYFIFYTLYFILYIFISYSTLSAPCSISRFVFKLGRKTLFSLFSLFFPFFLTLIIPQSCTKSALWVYSKGYSWHYHGLTTKDRTCTKYKTGGQLQKSRETRHPATTPPTAQSPPLAWVRSSHSRKIVYFVPTHVVPCTAEVSLEGCLRVRCGVRGGQEGSER